MPTNPKPIPDHIFGDLDQPENSAPWLLTRNRGIHHHYCKIPLNPAPGDAIRLYATASDDQPFTHVDLWYSTDEWHTQHQLPFAKADLTWDTLHWGWIQTWDLTLPPQTDGTMLRYKIGAHLACGDKWTFADNQSRTRSSATHFSLWYAENHFPTWAKHVIVYQVFVDRFHPGEGRSWLQTTNLMQPFGGTLRGVAEHLEYIKGMGFNAIWLTPIFASPSHHGYDISNYLKINPRFGSLADFDALIARAHHLGMRVILDFVANHCSNQHPAFIDALIDPASPTHDWFTWKPWPEYKCYYHVREMPELDLHYGRPARQYLLGVAQYWLKRGVDGFRLDYAHGPEQDFWVDFQRACRQVNPDCWTFGEIVQPADRQASFAGGIDGSLDFLLCQALRLTFAQQTWHLSRLAGFLQAHLHYYPEGFSLPAFIDNHDMNRFLFAAHEDMRLLKMALLLLYFLPGPPVVYYGTEVGLSQNRSIHDRGAHGFDEARLPMDWGNPTHGSLSDLLAKLAEIRTGFGDGEIHVRHCDEESMILQRGEGARAQWLLLNRSDQELELSLAELGSTGWVDGLTGKEITLMDEHLSLSMPAKTGILLIKSQG